MGSSQRVYIFVVINQMHHFFFSRLLQGAPTQEAGPGSGDPALPPVYAPPPSYPPPGQGPPASASRLPTLDFGSPHATSEYPEHPQLRVYQGPQHEGADSLASTSTVRAADGDVWKIHIISQ